MILRRARSRRATGRAEEPTSARTYSIWGFAALFVLIGLAGLFWLLWGPEPDEGSVLLDTPQTLPEPSGAAGSDRPSPPTTERSGVAGLIPGTSSVTTSIAGGARTPTMPDGSDAPSGVTGVVVEGDTVRLRFGGVGSDVLPDGWAARVAPTTLTPVGERRIELSVGCASSSDERLAEIAVTEGDGSITVATAVVAPPDGEPCAGADPTVLQVPLQAPVADRLLIAVPAGTDLSEVLGGD